MQKLYIQDNQNFLSYDKQINSKNKAPYILFIHGFMSDMNGNKATALKKYCADKGYNFIRFDNFGCGDSSGQFTDQTISNWVKGVELILEHHSKNNEKIILVASSLGAWLAMIVAKKHHKKINGIVTLAAAIDFTKNLIWDKLKPNEQKLMQEKRIYHLRGTNKECDYIYPITYQLIKDAEQYLMLEDEIDITLPITLIHGMKDHDIPYTTSLKLAERLVAQQVVIKLVKDADHKLSRAQDLQILYDSINEIVNLT